MKEKMKKSSLLKAMFHYLTKEIKAYNMGRVNCMA